MKHAVRIVLVVYGLLVWLAFTAQPARADWHTLSGRWPEHTQGYSYKISPDSRYVAYVADVDTDDTDELYIVAIEGGTPLKLNPALAAGGDVRQYSFEFSLDSKFVFYLADQEVDNRYELYRVPVSGGQAVKWSAPLVSGGNVGNFTLDPKGQYLVYYADQATNEMYELWSVPIGGGQAVRLNGPLISGGTVGIYKLDRYSNRVVYSAKQESTTKYELYSAPLAGGSFVKLSPPITLGGGGDSGIFSDFDVNPQIQVVVFSARETGSTHKHVYMVPTAGGIPATRLSFDLSTEQSVLGFRISPGGDRVVFNVGTRSGNNNPPKGNLYSVLLGGGGLVNLTETADPLFGVGYYDFSFTPDGKYAIYRYQKNAAARERVETSTVQGGVRATLYEWGASDEPYAGAYSSPNSQWIVYLSGQNPSAYRLNAVPPTGGSPTTLGLGSRPLITPDSGRVVFAQSSGPQRHSELFSTQIFGGDERNLSGMENTGYVGEARASADGKWIVYSVQIDSRFELRVSDGRAAQAPTTPTPSASASPSPSPSPSASPSPVANRLLVPMAQR